MNNISWDYGERFKVVETEGDSVTFLVWGCWPWSERKPKRATLVSSGGLWFWQESGICLRLAPEYLWQTLSNAKSIVSSRSA